MSKQQHEIKVRLMLLRYRFLFSLKSRLLWWILLSGWSIHFRCSAGDVRSSSSSWITNTHCVSPWKEHNSSCAVRLSWPLSPQGCSFYPKCKKQNKYWIAVTVRTVCSLLLLVFSCGCSLYHHPSYKYFRLALAESQ